MAQFTEKLISRDFYFSAQFSAKLQHTNKTELVKKTVAETRKK